MLEGCETTDSSGATNLARFTKDLPIHNTHAISNGDFESPKEKDDLESSLTWQDSEARYYCADVFSDFPSDDEMASQVKRLQTFRNWPTSCPVKPKDLAAAGFYYTGVNDQVRCFRCDLTLRKWESGDDPLKDHKNRVPDCRFFRETAPGSRYEVTFSAVEATTCNDRTSERPWNASRPSNAPPTNLNTSQPQFQEMEIPGTEMSGRAPEGALCTGNEQKQFCFQERTSGLTGSETSLGSFRETSFRNNYAGGYLEGSQSYLQGASLSAATNQGRVSDREVGHLSNETSSQEYHQVPPYTENRSTFVPGQSGGVFHPGQVKKENRPVTLALQSKDQEKTMSFSPGGGVGFFISPGNHINITSGEPGFPRTMTSQDELPSFYPQDQGNPPEVQRTFVMRATEGAPIGNERFVHSVSQPGSSLFATQFGSTGRETEHSRYPKQDMRIPRVEQGRPRPSQMGNAAYPVVDPTLQVHRPLFRQEEARHVSSPTYLASEHHRLTTFVDWPQDSPVRPWELSVAGFHYMGTGDSVKCYRCGVALRNWEPEDTPWGEHKKWSSQCPLVLEHFRGRAQMVPIEGTAGVSQGRQSYAPYVQSQSPLSQSPIGRRSPPTTRPPHSQMPGWRANDPSTGPSISSSQTPTSRNAGGLSVTALGTTSNLGPSRMPAQEARSHNVPLAGPTPIMPQPSSVQVSSITPADLERFAEMGFERDQVSEVMLRRVASTGRSFSSSEELLQALLSCGAKTRPGMAVSESASIPQSTASHFSAQTTLPALPRENEEIPPGSASSPSSPSPRIENLRRTMSVPLASSSRSPEREVGETLQQKLDRMQEERTCKICMDAEVGVVFLPCGHLSCCSRCATGMDLCPMCRAPIQESIRTFLS